MRIAIEVGSLCFATKTAAREHFQAMLYRYDFGVPIPEPDATELAWLLERHPEYSQKLGSGIDYFITEKTIYGARGFSIVRTDKTVIGFSYLTCIDGKAATPLSEALQAMRAEVTDDILQKKRDWFRDHAEPDGTVPCAITGVPIKIEDADADHAPPRTFNTLALAFLEARGIDPADFVAPSTNKPPNVWCQFGASARARRRRYMPFIKDPELAKAWRDYHHKLAVIRVVARGPHLAQAHLSKVREKDRQLRL
jgi:hypothetical protein